LRQASPALLLTAWLCGCTPKTYVPDLATRPYPFDKHTTTVADIQCFRRDTQLEVVNSTARSYSNFDLWINQRYVHRVESLPAGRTIRLSLWDFIDDYGQRFYAGGFFRSYPPEPLRLVEIQGDAESPMLGLIAVRSEEVKTIQKLPPLGF
jgi:hypothetical protein